MIKNERGITLIVLIVSIIIMVILAGVGIKSIISQDGIINNSEEAKEETAIVQEKEIIATAAKFAMEENSKGEIEKTKLEKKLENESKGITFLIEKTEEGKFIITFENADKQRSYILDSEGNVENYQK